MSMSMLALDVLTTLVAETAVHNNAAAPGQHHWDWFKLGSQYVNFIILFGGLAYLIRKPLQTFLETRRENMAGQLREAQAKQAEAERRLAEYGQKLDRLEDEIARVVSSFEAQGEADRQRLVQEGDKAVERLVREVDFTIRQESIKATKDIRDAGVQATLAMAEKLIVERITDSDRRRLADEYITQVLPTSSTVPPKGPAS